MLIIVAVAVPGCGVASHSRQQTGSPPVNWNTSICTGHNSTCPLWKVFSSVSRLSLVSLRGFHMEIPVSFSSGLLLLTYLCTSMGISLYAACYVPVAVHRISVTVCASESCLESLLRQRSIGSPWWTERRSAMGSSFPAFASSSSLLPLRRVQRWYVSRKA
jgi:hypothetical protein